MNRSAGVSPAVAGASRSRHSGQDARLAGVGGETPALQKAWQKSSKLRSCITKTLSKAFVLCPLCLGVSVLKQVLTRSSRRP